MSNIVHIRVKRVNRKKRKAGLATLRKYGRQHFVKASRARKRHGTGCPRGSRRGRKPLITHT